jgi:hypothetical protein
LAIDLALGAHPSGAQPITPVLPWLFNNAHRFGFSWEFRDGSEPWHVRYVDGDNVPAAVLAHETPAPLPPPTLGVPDMAFIVGREQDKTDLRRWVCNGVSLRLLESPAEHERLVQLSAVGLVSLHPSFASLAAPFWMSDAEIGTYQ